MINPDTPSAWRKDIDVMFDSKDLQTRVKNLALAICKEYEENTELCVVGILKGSVPFLADLIKCIELPLHVEFMGISSYGDDTKSSGVVQITSDLTKSIEGKDVLIVEDIVDTGLTIQYLLDNLSSRKPKSLKVCTLLDKPSGRKCQVDVDFVGFEIPDAFVIGYGLDFAGKYRNLPFIGTYHGPV